MRNVQGRVRNQPFTGQLLDDWSIVFAEWPQNQA
jgi:hypothetical protein